jgi:large conductance mechanosensitive channel
MFEEFKKFAISGNVLDLAVGVIIGAAFGKITASLVEDIINPIIGTLLPTGNLATASFSIGNAVVKYGNFLNNIIQFLIVAWVLFMIVRAANKMKKAE